MRLGTRCGMTWCGADGPARRSGSVSRRGGRDHRQFARRELLVPRQDGQVAKTKFLARNCLRILDQSLDANASSLTNKPAA